MLVSHRPLPRMRFDATGSSPSRRSRTSRTRAPIVRSLGALHLPGTIAGQRHQRWVPRAFFAFGCTLLLLVQGVLGAGKCDAAPSEAAPFWVSLVSPVANGIPAND